MFARPGGIPKWAYAALLVGPAVGIVILLGLKLSRGPEVEPVVQTDPNEEISALEKQVRGLQADYREVVAMLRKEDPGAKTRFEQLQLRMDQWLQKWDTLFDKYRDANNGQLPDWLKGYKSVRADVNTLLSDLNRASPF